MPLLLMLLFLVILALAFSSVFFALGSARRMATDLTGDRMPKTLRTIAYMALIVLMFGVSTGWLGAA